MKSSEVDNSQVREIGRSVVTAWLEHRSVATLKHGDAVDLMERVGAAIEAERVSLAKNQKGDADVLPRQELIARIEKQIRLWNNDTVTMACADMLADLKQTSVPASATNEWALHDLAEGFIGSHERLHFNHNARIVLSKVSGDAATAMRDKCVATLRQIATDYDNVAQPNNGAAISRQAVLYAARQVESLTLDPASGDPL